VPDWVLLALSASGEVCKIHSVCSQEMSMTLIDGWVNGFSGNTAFCVLYVSLY